MEVRQKRKVVIDFNIEFPIEMKADFVAGVIRDYIHLCRFTSGTAEVSIYPANTKVVQQALSLASNLKDIKQ